MFLDKIHYMPMHQFGRIADIVCHNSPYTFVKKFRRARAAQPHANAAAPEQSLPERVVLINPKPARNTDGQSVFQRSGLYSVSRRRSLREEHFVFFFEHINAFAYGIALVGIDALAVIARRVLPAVRKRIHAHLAMVLTTRTNFLSFFEMIRFQQLI